MEENVLKEKCVIIGGSAGSLQVILYILSHLPQDYHIPVIVVLHRKNDHNSNLTEVLNNRSCLPVKEAEDKESIVPGMVYVAPADYHLLVEKGHTFSLDASEKVHFSRPSIDVTLQTGAEAYGEGLISVLLSGANEDGTEGLERVYKVHGIRIVQDPQDAQVQYMPQSAITHHRPEQILNKQGISDYLNTLTGKQETV